MNKVYNKASETAKRKILRNNLPLPEVLLWQQLKNRQLEGYKFRRQYSINRYVIDFYCPNLKVAIEIDGDSHYKEDAQEYDIIRENFIKEYGVKFLRFSNEDVKNNLPQVLQRICQTCNALNKHGGVA